MTFPNYFRIDYVRVYQNEDGTIGCDPDGEFGDVKVRQS